MAISIQPAQINKRSKRLWLLDRPDPVLEKAGLQPLVVGRVKRESREFMDTGVRKWPFYSITFVWQGRLRAEGASHGRKWVESDQIYLQFPGLWHRYSFDGRGPVEEYWIHFRGFIPDAYRREGLLDPNHPVVTPPDPLALRRHFERCLSRRKEDPETPYRLAADFFSILSQVVRGAQKMHQTDNSLGHFLEGSVQKMSASLGEATLSFRQMTIGAGPWGYAHLRRRFKERYGLSPERYFAGLKISAAKDQLARGNERLLEIAKRLGYHDAYHFSHRFTKAVGMSPRAYRAVVRGGS